ncbi:MAG: FecR domain-containing protein, partial [Myxococcota bacterium]
MSGSERLHELLVPYARGELEPLQAQWVAARLARDPKLAARADSLRAALTDARSYAPELDANHRERLLARVHGMHGLHEAPARPRGWLWGAMALAAVVLAVSIGFLLGTKRDGSEHGDIQSQEPMAFDFSGDDDGNEFDGHEFDGLTVDAKRGASGFARGSDPQEEQERSGPARREVSANLRALVSRDWSGRVDGDEQDSHVRVDRGSIAFAFRGGEGRRLEVSTDHARVVVVGTRFSVGVSGTGARAATVVEVSQGAVEVWRGRRRYEVSAGERGRFS